MAKPGYNTCKGVRVKWRRLSELCKNEERVTFFVRDPLCGSSMGVEKNNTFKVLIDNVLRGGMKHLKAICVVWSLGNWVTWGNFYGATCQCFIKRVTSLIHFLGMF